jgi:hypothetical protein
MMLIADAAFYRLLREKAIHLARHFLAIHSSFSALLPATTYPAHGYVQRLA